MKIANLFVSASLSLAVLLGGCSKDDPAEKMVTLMEEMGNAAEKAGDDCGKMADNVEAVLKKYDLKALKESSEKYKGDKDAAKKMKEKYAARMEKAMPKLLGMMKCSEDPKMKAVNEKFKDVM